MSIPTNNNSRIFRKFVLGAPQLKKATLHLEHGKTFTIEAMNFSSKNIYNEKAFLNGTRIETPFITDPQIMIGGNLKFDMTNK